MCSMFYFLDLLILAVGATLHFNANQLHQLFLTSINYKILEMLDLGSRFDDLGNRRTGFGIIRDHFEGLKA